MRLKFQYITLHYDAFVPKFQGNGNVEIDLLNAIGSAPLYSHDLEERA